MVSRPAMPGSLPRTTPMPGGTSSGREFLLGCKLHVTETCDDPPPCTCGPASAAGQAAAGSAGEGAQDRGHDKGCAHLVFPNLITHVATTDATVTGNQMTTAICEDLTRQNLAPGRSYLDSGYLSAAVVVSALTTRAAPGSLVGCDLWESRDSWHHGSSIPRGLSGRARVAMFRPDNSPRTAAMGAAGRRVAARPVIGRPKPTWTAGTCPDSAGPSSPVALACQPSGGLPGCKVPEHGGGAVTGGLSQRRV
jgi:hypothetical protein